MRVVSTGRSEELRSMPWFNWTAPAARPAGPFSAVVRAGVGLAVGILLLASHRVVAGTIVSGISVLIGIISVASPAARARVDRFFERSGHWIGKIVSWALLAPLFLVVFSIVRVWQRLNGFDPLQLARSSGPTYWLEADEHSRKVRYASAMFATERIGRRGFSGLAALAVLGLALVVSEVALRFWGFGSPVLYVSDAQVGYYPAPNQIVDRYRGRIEINAFGMRAPQYAKRKLSGTFRILMIGDSTLYGGSYIDQRELYSRQLEQHLRSAAGGRRVEILAVGVNAWGPFHEIGYIEKFGTFDADLAMICLPVEDIYRPLYGIEKLPFSKVHRPPRLGLEELMIHLAWRLRETENGPPSAEERSWNGQHGLEAYNRLAGLLRNRGIEVMFQVLPSSQTGTGGPVRATEARDVERLRAATAAAGTVNVAFPTGLFRDSKGRIYHDESHLDVDGHRLYSEYLRSEVTTRSRKWIDWIASARLNPSLSARR
jgi:hypothetical protein